MRSPAESDSPPAIAPAAEKLSGAIVATAPPSVDAYNPAFDVTPASLITGIITDRGIHRPPYHFPS